MRIVSVNVHYQDGLGYQDYYLGKALKEKGHEVIFVASDWHFRFPDYENTVQRIIGPRYVGTGVFENDYGCKVHRLQSKLIKGVYWLEGFKSKLQELKPDLIISHGIFTFQSMRLSIWGKQLNCPIIYDDHTTSTFYRKDMVSRIIFTMFRQLFAKRIYQSAKKIVGISASCIDVLRDVFGIAGSKVEMIPLGADTDTYFPDEQAGELYRQEIRANKNEILVVYTGKIYDAKRLHIIFAALNEAIIPQGKCIYFHVVGDVAENYQPTFQQSQLDFKHRFSYCPAVDQATLARIYNAADFCVWLDFTNSTIEASACGCPIIVTDLMPERVIEGSGILVDRNSLQEVAAATNKLINNETTRKGMSVIGHEFATSTMSWSAHALRFIKDV